LAVAVLGFNQTAFVKKVSMKTAALADLPDDEYRAHWLAFHEQTDWAAHKDVTAVRVEFVGPDALYRRNKGSFMDDIRRDVHCRPYAGHARRARRTGAWVPEEKVFELSLYPGHDFTHLTSREPAGVAHILRTWFQNVSVPMHRSAVGKR
jgi:hypothetical protein